MRRMLPVVLLVILLVSAGAVMAMDTPTIRVPAQGAALGPNFDISGSMPHRAFLIVITDCVRTDTGEVLGSVPGIRHWTETNGQFHFRCASPRVAYGDLGVTLEYRVRCFETTASNGNGPEAVVNCRMAP
ncbi:MAG: hypothetical protein WCP21_02905 [Armatimonadota bacterium]